MDNEPVTPPPQPTVPVEIVETNRPMGLLDHLEDLRWTLFKSAMAFAIASAGILCFLGPISEALQWPLHFAMEGRSPGHGSGALVNTSILGVFSVLFYLVVGGGFALSLPFILFFIGQFVSPALNAREVRLLRPFCLTAMALFLGGAGFSFFILCPATIKAAVALNDIFGFEPFWSASSYYSLIVWMVAGVGLAFEFPLVLIVLIYLGLVSTATLSEYRRLAMVGFLCLSAAITPTTDPITFMLLALPLYVLYEIAIFFGRRVERRQKA